MVIITKILFTLPVVLASCAYDECCGDSCNDNVIRKCVCAFDKYCCEKSWDDQCKTEAELECSLACGGMTPVDQIKEVRASVVEQQAKEFDCERYCAAAMGGCKAEEVGTEFSYPDWTTCMASCATLSHDGTPYDFVLADNIQCRTNHLEFITIYNHPAKRHCPQGIGEEVANCNMKQDAQIQAGTEAFGKAHWNAGTDVSFTAEGVSGLQEVVAAVSYLATSRTRMNSYALHPTETGTAFTGKNSMCDYNDYQKFRSYDGSCNYLEDAAMGKVHTGFSRQTRGWSTEPEPLLSTPDPYKVAPKLKRVNKANAPTAWFNQLAVAWIQFQTHDWFQHAPTDPNKGPMPKEGPLKNDVTHWWDANQLYGSTFEQNKLLRVGTHGLIHLDQMDELDYNFEGMPITGFSDNWWPGLHILHTLFAREHNYICKELVKEYADTMSDEELFQTARLIVSAVIAKIHTVEWTPGILDNPALNLAMHINWYGVQDAVKMLYGDSILAALKDYLSAFEGIPGINGIGKSTYLANSPMQIPEEFVSAYRFHPLLPDEITVDGQVFDLQEMYFTDPRKMVPENTTETFMKSFGTAPAFALTLTNYPALLMELEKPNVGTLNLAAVDIMRDRSRGVPRYAEACRQMGMGDDVPKTFEDLTDNEDDLKILRELYSDIEEVDFLVGSMAASNRPKGYGFGTLAFRIFTVMASRRLQTDRFFQEDYNADHYTQWGMDYIKSASMASTISRHFPDLTPLFEGKKNAFYNWD